MIPLFSCELTCAHNVILRKLTEDDVRLHAGLHVLKTGVELASNINVGPGFENNTEGGVQWGMHSANNPPIIIALKGGDKHIHNGTLRLGNHRAISLDTTCKGVTFSNIVFLGAIPMHFPGCTTLKSLGVIILNIAHIQISGEALQTHTMQERAIALPQSNLELFDVIFGAVTRIFSSIARPCTMCSFMNICSADR